MTTATASTIKGFSDSSKKVFEFAQKEANALGFKVIGSEHLLLGLLSNKDDVVAEVLNATFSSSFTNATNTINSGSMYDKIKANLPKNNPFSASATPSFSSETKGILELARREAENRDSETINPEHLLYALFNSNSAAKNFLVFFAINQQSVERMIQDKKQKNSNTSSAQNNQISDTVSKIASGISTVIDVATTAANAASEAIKSRKVAKSTPGLSRDEWIKILDKSIDMSKKTGISVPSCFIQISMLSQSTVDRSVASQIRVDAIHDIVQSILDIDHK